MLIDQGRLNDGIRELRSIAKAHEQAGDLKAMAAAMHSISEAVPNNLDVKQMLIDVYLRRGILDEALSELESMAVLKFENYDIDGAIAAYSRAAEIACAMGNFALGNELYDRGVAADPNNVPGSTRCGRILSSDRIGRPGSRTSCAKLCVSHSRNATRMKPLRRSTRSSASIQMTSGRTISSAKCLQLWVSTSRPSECTAGSERLRQMTRYCRRSNRRWPYWPQLDRREGGAFQRLPIQYNWYPNAPNVTADW